MVLFDEFEEVERLGGDLLLKRMRAIFQRQEHTAYFQGEGGERDMHPGADAHDRSCGAGHAWGGGGRT